ncbi:gamma-glutamyl kinase [Roseibacterium sp. SDUM158016]|uniref:gamma-glutamyl kinase n=1 Tax=Roseicyclus sediminis TaxID=2980997 RepID=UPI0021D2CDF6|nr:gamma-glutamyl kinase [Roseibacterium sp. SDUM158016]MCU4655208.1 gamma-glutamyl kinase [Roseibacterium sp. SDUM158016]
MLVFWKARLVLLAVPKTGTTALEAAFLPHADAAILNPPGLKHMNVRRYRTHLARLFEQNGARPMELMAVMREPVDWLSSWYRFRRRGALSGQPQSTEGVSFGDFVEAWLRDDPPEYARVGRQARFLEAETGGTGIDRLFRHDALGEAVSFLEDRLSVEVALDRHNVSPTGIDTALDPKTEARLRAGATEDFALWDALCEGRVGRA